MANPWGLKRSLRLRTKSKCLLKSKNGTQFLKNMTQQEIMSKYLNRIQEHLIRLKADKFGETGFSVCDANCGNDVVTFFGGGLTKNVHAKDVIPKLQKMSNVDQLAMFLKNA